MELRICHLYPELLNMYGDVGNVKILRYRAEKRDISVEVCNLSNGEPFEGEKYDIVVLGGGQDFEMDIVSSDLSGEKKEALRAYIENGGVLLAIGSGYQLLGSSYYTSSGEKRDGLGFFSFITEKSDERLVGNIAVEIEGITAVGFENHGGKTYIGDMMPMGRVLSGHGNNGEDKTEGFRYKNTFGTFLHGPMLSKSPEFADKLLEIALGNRYGAQSLAPLSDEFEHKARENMLSKMSL